MGGCTPILTAGLARLCLGLISLCGIAIAVGHLNVSAMPGPEFGHCDGRPCLVNMSPGVTSWMDAHAAFRRLPNAEISGKRIVIPFFPGVKVEFYPSLDEITVGRAYIILAKDRPLPAGWVILRYGPPCGVSIYFRTGPLMTLRYPFLLANIDLSDKAFTPHAPLTSLQFKDPAFESRIQPDLCVDNVSSDSTINRRWQGFITPEKYLAQG